MKKLLALALAVVLALSVFAGCAAGGKKAELALITDIGTIDDKSFNQGAWEGLVKYAEEKGISHQYYQPTEKSTTAYLESIDQAVKNGAKVIVTPGFLFEEPVYIAQDQYPDVTFILIDGNPHDADYNYKTADNCVGITYAEEQVGFLAGYAAVKDGMTKLGYMGGMAVPAVVKYGYGFVQGAEYAAQELGMADGSIELMYNYTGGSPEPGRVLVQQRHRGHFCSGRRCRKLRDGGCGSGRYQGHRCGRGPVRRIRDGYHLRDEGPGHLRL